MYYLPILLLALYWGTFFAQKTPSPPHRDKTHQVEPAKKNPAKQPSVEEVSPMMAPSEYVERKGDVKKASSKEGTWSAQGQESDFPMLAPSEPVEAKGEAKDAATEVRQEVRSEQESDIAMIAPSEPIEVNGKAKETVAEVRQETQPVQRQESNIEMIAPSEPIETKGEVKEAISEAKQEVQPVQKQESNIEMIAPSELIETKGEVKEAVSEVKQEMQPQQQLEPNIAATPMPDEKVAEAKIEAKNETKVEAKAIEEVVHEKGDNPNSAVLEIKDVNVKKIGKLTRVEITTSGEAADYNVFNLDTPDRVVVDIENAKKTFSKWKIKAVSPHIKSVRLGQHDKRVRIVFDCKGKLQPYEIVNDKKHIRLFFGKKPEPEKQSG